MLTDRGGPVLWEWLLYKIFTAALDIPIPATDGTGHKAGTNGPHTRPCVGAVAHQHSSPG